MRVDITYRMKYEPHPWDDKLRQDGVKVWCLVKVTTAKVGAPREEAVACFDSDRDALDFQTHVFVEGEQLVEIEPELREEFQAALGKPPPAT